ncbi:MAG: hypothetical protein A2096_15805 [Spirochaetes bacterium GWF1_41_5]|nr:MAG: hypothetical protein A2096_15805 [Spirochaetes bacterium GWF1_41_5]HBE00893.1 hypothetical protein [Spirochaetia bacterium]
MRKTDALSLISRAQFVYRIGFLLRMSGAAAAIFTLFFILFSSADHIFFFPVYGRFLIFFFFLLLAVFSIIYIFRALLACSALQAADAIEKKYPVLKQALRSRAEFSDPAAPVSDFFRREITVFSDQLAQNSGISLLPGPLQAFVLLFSCLLLIFPAVLALRYPVWTKNYTRRLFLPLSSARPLATVREMQYFKIKPGTVKVPRGGAVRLLCQVPRLKNKYIILRIRKYGQEKWREEQIYASGQGEEFFRVFNQIKDPFYYCFRDGMRTSETYSILVMDLPEIESFSIHYKYPPHTGLKARVVQSKMADLQGPEHTSAEITVLCSKKVSRAEIDFEKGKRLILTRLQKNNFVFKINLNKPNRFWIKIIDTDGNENFSSSQYLILPRPDAPPKIRITAPRSPAQAAPTQKIIISYRASDDWQISNITLAIAISNNFSNYMIKNVITRESRGHIQLNLSNLQLRDGGNLRCRICVADNDPQGFKTACDELLVLIQEELPESGKKISTDGIDLTVYMSLLSEQREFIKKLTPYTRKKNLSADDKQALEVLAEVQMGILKKTGDENARLFSTNGFYGKEINAAFKLLEWQKEMPEKYLQILASPKWKILMHQKRARYLSEAMVFMYMSTASLDSFTPLYSLQSSREAAGRLQFAISPEKDTPEKKQEKPDFMKDYNIVYEGLSVSNSSHVFPPAGIEPCAFGLISLLLRAECYALAAASVLSDSGTEDFTAVSADAPASWSLEGCESALSELKKTLLPVLSEAERAGDDTSEIKDSMNTAMQSCSNTLQSSVELAGGDIFLNRSFTVQKVENSARELIKDLSALRKILVASLNFREEEAVMTSAAVLNLLKPYADEQVAGSADFILEQIIFAEEILHRAGCPQYVWFEEIRKKYDNPQSRSDTEVFRDLENLQKISAQDERFSFFLNIPPLPVRSSLAGFMQENAVK